jgi:ABC-2 type transport system ATP-binding protein
MIAVDGLTKRYGSTAAVSDLSFRLRRGVVTGFLGPNGAGKTTTMRLILGLDYPSAGIVTIDGRPHQQSPAPMHEVGALLEARAVHGGRSARNHLLCLAQTNRIPASRVDEVLGMVGLADVGRKRSKGFSLGMSQRLGIAAALLGDPEILMFDEPVNGLDPEGILWIRTLMKSLAAEGRTVFVSSHLMSEMENTADSLIVIGRGRLIADCSMAEFIARSSGHTVRVRTPEPDRLARAVAAAGARITGPPAADGAAGRPSAGGPDGSPVRPGELDVSGLTEEQIGDIAFANGIRLHHLSASRASLEHAFMELTASSVDYHAEQPAGRLPAQSGIET